MINIVTAFSGIGAYEKALQRIGVEYNLLAFSEIDKYAIKSYCTIHNEPESKNINDITKSNHTFENLDLFCFSPPCQSYSVAGKQMGMEDPRGILFYDALRIIRNSKPRYCVMENVKGLTQKKFKNEFEDMLGKLEETGYNNYWKVLNSKNFGVAQNRERVFVISIRKDIDDGKFEFPTGFDNGLRLKDFLENILDEKYYISDEKVEKLLDQLHKCNRGYSHAICASVGRTTEREYFKKNQGQLVMIGNVNPSGNGMNGEVYSSEGIAPTVTTNKGEGSKIAISCLTPEPNVLRYERTEYGKAIRKEYESGLIDECIGNMRKPTPRTDGICNTLSTVQKDNMLVIPCLTPDRTEKRQNGRRFKDDGEPMFTLTGQDRHGVLEVGKLEGKNFNQNKVVYSTEGISPTIHGQGHCGNEPKVIETNEPKFLGNINNENFGTGFAGGVWDSEHISPTLTTMQGGGRQPHILDVDRNISSLEPKILEDFYANREVREYDDCPTIRADRQGLKVIEQSPSPELLGGIGETNFGKQYRQGNRVYDADKTAMCLLSQPVGNTGGNSYLYAVKEPRYRIRKLTPKECWRLQAFDDADIDKCIAVGISNSQLYKQAGNSITVTVLENIFKNLFKQ